MSNVRITDDNNSGLTVSPMTKGRVVATTYSAKAIRNGVVVVCRSVVEEQLALVEDTCALLRYLAGVDDGVTLRRSAILDAMESQGVHLRDAIDDLRHVMSVGLVDEGSYRLTERGRSVLDAIERRGDTDAAERIET